MRLIELMATAVLVTGLGACSSGGAGGGAPTNCVDVSGSWSLSGSCPISSCAVTQNGCNVTLVCGSDTFTGTVSGSTISFSDPQAGNCSGSVSSSSTSGSCSGASGSCSFNGSCSSGPCGAPSTGGGGGGGFGGGGTGGGGFGGGGTGGGGTIDCNTACGDITSCCTSMTMSDCLTGCQQNAPSAACQACFTNTSCGTFVPCVTAQCGVPSVLCPAPVEP